jgi:imidazolonepropionase-like amidohydrolase
MRSTNLSHMLRHSALVRLLVVVAAIPGVFLLSAPAQTKRIRPAAEHVVFKCKLLINPASGGEIQDAAVEVNNGKILRVGKSSEFTDIAGVKVVDYGDKYVIPGLIDTHGHLYGGVNFRQTTHPAIPIFYLAAGVTTVGSPGSMDPGGDLAMRNRINSGVYLGPRYFLAGEYIEMEPLTVGWMNPVRSPEEARLKVDHWASQGASMIKIYVGMHGEILRAAIEEAHEQGLRVAAHIGAVTYKEAISLGVDELFHGVLALPDTRPEGVDQRDYKRWVELTAKLDLTDPRIQEALKMAARARVVLCPTAIVMEPLDMAKWHLEEQKKYYTSAAWEGLQKIAGQLGDIESPESVAKNRRFIKMANDAGCILSTGTDLVVFLMLPGYSLWREMEIFGEAGLTPMEVLKAATYGGAYALGRTDQLGSVEAGKLADFVVLNQDPTASIGNVRSVYRVVKGGVVYDPAELLKPWVGRIY